MRYRKLGRTGLRVSEISLGTVTYGDQVGEADAERIIQSALASGVNFFDSADAYVEGRAEEILGKALKNERHAVVLATKVAQRNGPDINDVGLSRKHIMKAVEDSLRRLQTDYVDIYYAHVPDNDTHIEETLHAFDDLIHQGKVRYIGCSNYPAWQLCKALWTSDVHKLARFECSELAYNLITRDIESELLPLCSSERVGVCVYNPLAGGLLTGKYAFDKPPIQGSRYSGRLGLTYRNRYWSDINFKAVGSFNQAANKRGCSLAQFALAWVLNNDQVTSAICGATSIKQLEENLKATEIELSVEELQKCDESWQKIRPSRFYLYQGTEMPYFKSKPRRD